MKKIAAIIARPFLDAILLTINLLDRTLLTPLIEFLEVWVRENRSNDADVCGALNKLRKSHADLKKALHGEER